MATLQIHRGELDGVRTLWADERVVQGPLRMCLLFGVGRCDETVTVSGINHLVEHLALQRLTGRQYPYNGQTRPTCTTFMVMAGPEEVVEFFAHVTRELDDLPLERIPDEARVLEVESEGHPSPQSGLDLSIRFGPVGPGLLGWPEHGLRRVGRDDVVDWARTWFTAQNAVLWSSGPLPPGLSLGALPQGTPPPRTEPRHLELPPRLWVPTRTRTVSLSVVSRQHWGVPTAMILARQRAFERLRGRDAISYQVDCLHLRIGGDQALEALSADGAPGNFAQVLDGLVEAVTEMASTGPDAEKLEELKRMYREAATHPEYVLGEMDSTAERCLLGLPTPTAEESDEKLQALTPDQLRDELAGLLPSLLAVGPNDLGEELPEWSTYVTWSRDSLEGRRYEPVAGREEGSLIVGNDGLSWELDDERRRTVLWADAAACFTWDSGQRSVIGPAGAYVDVLPWNWQNGQDLTQTIDGSVDQRLLIRLGEGQATYLQKRDDPDSVADLHWLGSVVGALHGQKRVDLLIETHGLYLLYGRTRTPRARLKELRAKDRGELLAEDPRNRWVPWSQVDRARLAGRFLAPIDDVKASLTIWCTGERALKVLLRNKAQVETLRGELPRVLGDRFKS